MVSRVGGGWLVRRFAVGERGSTPGREVLAGVSTYMALSYIFIVNPAILSEAGMDPSAVMIATILCSAAATIAMGLWANLPFVLAPGLEMNAYVAFFVVTTLGFTWQEALGAVFWSGVIFLVLTASGFRKAVIDSVPSSLKAALAFSVGAFLILIALRVSGVLQYNGVRPGGLGSLTSPGALTLIASFVLALVFDRLGVRAGVLLSIIAASLLWPLFGGARPSIQGSNGLQSLSTTLAAADIEVILDPRIIGPIMILFVIDFYGSVAKLVGLSTDSSIEVKGEVPSLGRALYVDGAATCAGAAVGTTSLTTFVESGVGIGVGGRTGLTALVCGALMLATLFAVPLLQFVPVEATTGALMLVGLKLFPAEKRSGWWLALLCAATVMLTFSLDKALAVGLIYVLWTEWHRNRRVPWPLAVSTGLVLTGWALQ